MNENTWDCPLLQKNISEGLCLDINYERLMYFKGGPLKQVMNKTGKTLAQVSIICENCPNFPL